jgi:hypothetical protein
MSAVATRPGQTYFVPGVRIMRLGPLKPGPEPGEEIEELAPDILHVEVTRVNSGSGQYCITLNNWFDTLPADRKAGAGQRELLRGEQPLWPRFKYNDFSVLQFGMRLRIDMRYWPDPDPSLSGSDAAAQRWVPMIAGPISDMRFSFSNTEGATLTVCGEDDLCPLKDKNPKKVDYWARPEAEIVEDTLRRRGYPLPVAKPLRPWPKFTESTAKALAEAHFEGQSYLDYLTHFAERMDFEIFIEFADLDDPGSGVEFHFEPSRSRTPPDKTLRDVYVVERGKNLLEFAPDLHVVDQWTSATVTGRDHSQMSPNMISATVPKPPAPPPEPLDDELHRDVARGDPPLVSGPEWRRKLYGPNPHTEVNQRGLDLERAEVMADALYRKRARKFLRIDGQTIGLPRLRPGRYVEIVGMRPPFDGFYYAEKAVYTYSKDGLRTHFHARRPGMPFPPYGEH